MSVSAMVFLGIVLFIFAVLDIAMIVSLIKPGDERNQMIVWKAGTYTLLVTVGAIILDMVADSINGQASSIHSLIHLELTVIIYFIALLYFKRKHGG